MLVNGYRLWPTAHSFQPRLLDSVTSETVEQLVDHRCKVLWAFAADVSSRSSIMSYVSGSGKWVAPSEACLVQPSDQLASAVIINVARRAGLHIPDVPAHVFKASRQICVSAEKLKNIFVCTGYVYDSPGDKDRKGGEGWGGEALRGGGAAGHCCKHLFPASVLLPKEFNVPPPYAIQINTLSW